MLLQLAFICLLPNLFVMGNGGIGTDKLFIIEEMAGVIDGVLKVSERACVHCINVVDCSRKCAHADDCLSFSYNPNTDDCQLHGGGMNMFKISTYVAASEYIQYKVKKKKLPIDCYDILQNGGNSSGLYNIYPSGRPKAIYCDQETDGGGWLVFQRRMDGSEDFYRNWYNYTEGFGDITREFWLGNGFLAKQSILRNYTLRIDLESFEDETVFAEYGIFAVGLASTNYSLQVGTYRGSAGDSLKRHNGRQFSTKDRDHDLSRKSCADIYHGAWWYTKCHDSNLNGYYHGGTHSSYADGVNWRHWLGYHSSLKKTEMKFRPALRW